MPFATALAQDQDALALIGLGSVGAELDRLDAYSDLDIFVIVAPGHKERFVNDFTLVGSRSPDRLCLSEQCPRLQAALYRRRLLRTRRV